MSTATAWLSFNSVSQDADYTTYNSGSSSWGYGQWQNSDRGTYGDLNLEPGRFANDGAFNNIFVRDDQAAGTYYTPRFRLWNLTSPPTTIFGHLAGIEIRTYTYKYVANCIGHEMKLYKNGIGVIGTDENDSATRGDSTFAYVTEAGSATNTFGNVTGIWDAVQNPNFGVSLRYSIPQPGSTLVGIWIDAVDIRFHYETGAMLTAM